VIDLLAYMRGVNVNGLRGIDGEDAALVVVVVDHDGLRHFGDVGALDHAGVEGVLAQAVGEGVRGVRVHDLDAGFYLVDEAEREGVVGLGPELGHGGRGDCLHLCTWGERRVVAGVFGRGSGAMLVKWVGRMRGFAREDHVFFGIFSCDIWKGFHHPLCY
jgi:hypothetical protein